MTQRQNGIVEARYVSNIFFFLFDSRQMDACLLCVSFVIFAKQHFVIVAWLYVSAMYLVSLSRDPPSVYASTYSIFDVLFLSLFPEHSIKIFITFLYVINESGKSSDVSESSSDTRIEDPISRYIVSRF